MHARNPKWEGPLCRYEVDDDARRKVNSFALTDDLELVTCCNCLNKLGRSSGRKMPGQRWLVKRKKQILGKV
jgi:hypothetical protein